MTSLSTHLNDKELWRIDKDEVAYYEHMVLNAPLEKLIDTINAMTHPTPAGPSSIPNNVVDFNAIKTELRTILSSQNFTV